MKILKVAGLTALLVGAVIVGASIHPSLSPQAPGQAETIAPAEPPRHVFLDLAWAGEAVVAVGENGQIWRSTDQGETWSAVPSGTDVLLTSGAFSTATNGWAVGHLGTVLRTQDGGRTWAQVQLTINRPAHFTAMDVAFADEQTGYIVGSEGSVLQTRDGGNTWQQSSPAHASYTLTGITTLPSGLAIVVADNGHIYRKAPDAEHWELSQSSYYQHLFGVVATGTEDGVLAYGADGTILLSEDGGVSWEQQKSVSTTAYHAGIRTADGSLVLGGDSGVIVRRHPGQNMFYLEPGHPVGAVLGLAETSDGALLLAGHQGLGRPAGNGYQFVGDELGMTGYLRTLQLMLLPETQHLLAHFASRPRDPTRNPGPRWVQLTATAKDDQSLLAPELLSQIQSLQLALNEAASDRLFSVTSLISSGLPTQRMQSGFYQHHPLFWTLQNRTYGEADDQALAYQIRINGADDVLISRDRKSIHFYLDIHSASPNPPHEALAAALRFLEELRATNNQNPESGYQIEPLQLVSLTATQHLAPEEKSQPAAKHTGREFPYVYVLTNSTERYGCDNSRLVVLAPKLELALRSVAGVQTTLSVAEIEKRHRASLHQDHWKWFTPGLERYQQAQYGSWASYGCLNPLVLIYGQPGAPDTTEALSAVVREELARLGARDLVGELQITAYRRTVDTAPTASSR